MRARRDLMRIDRELNIQNADKRFWTDMYLIISILSLIFIVNNSYHNASSSPPSFIIYHLFTLFKNYKYDFMFWINSYGIQMWKNTPYGLKFENE